MTAAALNNELAAVGRKLGRWQAELWATLAGTVVLGLLWLLCWADIFLHFTPRGRLIVWAVLLALLAAAGGLIAAALRRQRSLESVAARVERTFTELDNRLINTVQFARAGSRSSLQEAYLRTGVPEWSQLDLRQLKDRRRHRWATLALGLVVALMVVPGLWSGPAWTNAFCRIINPFSQRLPSTLASIRDVQPRNGTAERGLDLALSVQADGKKGQEVWLDLWPADDKSSSVKLGRLTGPGTEEFSYTVPKLASNLKYRFRAGDARSERYQITVLPPLAFAKISVNVKPPAYTKLPVQSFDGLADELVVPQGATVSVSWQCNRPLASAAVAGAKATVHDGTWTATVPVGATPAMHLAAIAQDGGQLALDLKCRMLPDKAPVIRVLAPAARTVLAAGAAPSIQWEVTDDYGVTKVTLESDTGELIQEWPVPDQRTFTMLWTGEAVRAGKSLAYRLTAADRVQRSRSPRIVFETASSNDIVTDQAQKASEAAVTLARLVELQSKNLDRTISLAAALATTKPNQWNETADAQAAIRLLTGQLLASPRKPLGALTPAAQELYQGPMQEVIDALHRLPNLPGAQQVTAGQQAVAWESLILKVLTAVKVSLPRVEQHRQITGVLALLDALAASQEDALGAAKALVAKAQPVSGALVQKQDKLAGDVADFVQVCRAEAQRLERGDAEFARLIKQVADGCESRKVAAEMLRAAEQLEAKAAAQAVPCQERALAVLKEFQTLLNQWRVREARDEMAAVKKAVSEARARFDKLVALQAKIVETMRIADQKKDLSGKDKEEMQAELAELKANVKDAALKVADDLHIFPELPVGNEVVKDIYQVFEEAKQVAGSEHEKATELGLQKEDWILDGMEQIKDRFDDMEMWLLPKPDNVRRLTENFDQQEMPKMAVISLPKEIDDIIGELLKQEQDIRDKSNDSATNQAAPDAPMGWEVAEGETSTFSGKGKSGNTTPDHKEQDGRSLVGRQGMSEGETVAGSGKINQGDEKLENRRTKDSAQGGNVQEEGHAKAVATGGGKQSGYAEENGMSGEGPRRDANLPGSPLGLQAMLRRNAQAIYAKASLLHIRTGSLDEAVRAMQDAEQALAKGLPAQQVREFQRRAVVALKKTQAELGSGFTESLGATANATPLAEQLAGVPEEAPANYRDLVSEYFKSLGGSER